LRIPAPKGIPARLNHWPIDIFLGVELSPEKREKYVSTKPVDRKVSAVIWFGFI